MKQKTGQFKKKHTPWNKGVLGYKLPEGTGAKISLGIKLAYIGRKEIDNWKCRIINNDCKGRLEAHHILNWKDYSELRYDINNGITLCHAHHPRGRANEKRLSPYFMELVSVSKE